MGCPTVLPRWSNGLLAAARPRIEPWTRQRELLPPARRIAAAAALVMSPVCSQAVWMSSQARMQGGWQAALGIPHAQLPNLADAARLHLTRSLAPFSPFPPWIVLLCRQSACGLLGFALQAVWRCDRAPAHCTRPVPRCGRARRKQPTKLVAQGVCGQGAGHSRCVHCHAAAGAADAQAPACSLALLHPSPSRLPPRGPQSETEVNQTRSKVYEGEVAA